MHRNKISAGKIKEYALQATILIGAYSLVLGFILSRLFGSEPFPLPVLLTFCFGFCIVCYILLRKMFEALAYDAIRKGIDDEIKRKYDGRY